MCGILRPGVGIEENSGRGIVYSGAWAGRSGELCLEIVRRSMDEKWGMNDEVAQKNRIEKCYNPFHAIKKSYCDHSSLLRSFIDMRVKGRFILLPGHQRSRQSNSYTNTTISRVKGFPILLLNALIVSKRPSIIASQPIHPFIR
jgi:hypothetical protein